MERLEFVGEVETGLEVEVEEFDWASRDCHTQPVRFENRTCHRKSNAEPVAGMGLGPPTTVPSAPFASVPRTEAFSTPWLRTLAGLAMELTATFCPTVNLGVTAAGGGVELPEELLDPELELPEELPPVLLGADCPGCAMSALWELKTTNVPYAGAVCTGALVNPHGTGLGPSPVMGTETVPPA